MKEKDMIKILKNYEGRCSKMIINSLYGIKFCGKENKGFYLIADYLTKNEIINLFKKDFEDEEVILVTTRFIFVKEKLK